MFELACSSVEDGRRCPICCHHGLHGLAGAMPCVLGPRGYKHRHHLWDTENPRTVCQKEHAEPEYQAAVEGDRVEDDGLAGDLRCVCADIDVRCKDVIEWDIDGIREVDVVESPGITGQHLLK